MLFFFTFPVTYLQHSAVNRSKDDTVVKYNEIKETALQNSYFVIFLAREVAINEIAYTRKAQAVQILWCSLKGKLLATQTVDCSSTHV